MPISFPAFLVGVAVTWAFIIGLLALHEWGHVVAMKRLGMRVDKVVLGVVKLFTIRVAGMPVEFGALPAGAFCVSADYKAAESNRRAWAALAGPAASAATGAAFYFMYLLTGHWSMLAATQGSVILVVTNMIPLPPLDGWTVAEHFLVKRGFVLAEAERKKLLWIGITTMVLIAVAI